MKFLYCLLALAVATVSASHLRGGYYSSAPALYGGYGAAYGYGHYAGYAPVYTPTYSVGYITPVVRVATVPAYSYGGYHSPLYGGFKK